MLEKGIRGHKRTLKVVRTNQKICNLTRIKIKQKN